MTRTTLPHYCDYLREELLERKARNPSYSARAFARDLDVSAPYLSQIMNGRRLLSERTALRIARKLRWDSQKARIFVTLLKLESEQDPSARTELLNVLGVRLGTRAYVVLQVDVFRAISRWYHGALLELATTEGFQSDVRWIAATLQISEIEAELAVDRLCRIGLLERRTSGALVPTNENVFVGDLPSQAVRTYHAQMLTLAARALAEQDFAERDISGISMAIDPETVPAAKVKIRQFRREMAELMQKGRKRALYHLSVQLFRLDKAGEKK